MGMGFMQAGIKLAVIYYRLFLRECKAEKILPLIKVHKICAPLLREAPVVLARKFILRKAF